MKQASVHYGGLTFTSDDVVTGDFVFRIFCFFGVIGRFFFTEFWIFKIGLQRCKFCCRHHHFSDIVYPMNSGKVW